MNEETATQQQNFGYLISIPLVHEILMKCFSVYVVTDSIT